MDVDQISDHMAVPLCHINNYYLEADLASINIDSDDLDVVVSQYNTLLLLLDKHVHF